jgi:hypothetical protein
MEEKAFKCKHYNQGFKNKNKAKRHKSSVHERPVSYSCAAIPGRKEEKRFKCKHCNQGFANKNRAKRHESSVHERPISWSCAAVRGRKDVFGQEGVCGFCGTKFENDWEARHQHLTDVHSYGECNPFREFYRSDHFRQHIRRYHGGRTGPWNMVLERASLKEKGDAQTEGNQTQQSASSNNESEWFTGQVGLVNRNFVPDVEEE